MKENYKLPIRLIKYKSKKLQKFCHAFVRGRDILFVNSIFIKRSPIAISSLLIFCSNKFTNLKLLVILLLVLLFAIY